MTRLVFFAHPIDFRDDVMAPDIRMALAGHFVIYDPLTAFQADQRHAPTEQLEKINYQAMARSDGVFAYLSGPTIGVPMEIERAHWMGLPCAVVVPPEVARRSWALKFRDRSMTQRVFTDYGQAVAWLSDQLHGCEQRVGPTPEPIKFAGEGQLPSRAYPGDAGFDLYVSPATREQGQNHQRAGHWLIRPGEFVDIDTGVAVELPPNTWAMMLGRSSTARRGLMVAQAVIDNGYRGPLYFGVTNLTRSNVWIEPGERLAQLVPFHLTAERLRAIKVDSLGGSERGERGFGSSGK